MADTKQAAFRALSGEQHTFDGDIIAGCKADEPTISAQNINGILYEWTGHKIKLSPPNSINGRLQQFALNKDAFNWSSLGDWLLPTSSIDAIVESSTTVESCKLYDVTGDSDGGAWRIGTDSNSLGKPPRALLVYSEGGLTDTVTAVDVTVSTPTVFKQWNVTNPTAVDAYDGKIVIASTAGVVLIDLKSDTVTLRDTTGVQLADQSPGTFDMTTVTWGTASGDGIASNTISDLSILALSSAQTNSSTLLPYATIAVATALGASIVNYDGTSGNENNVRTGTQTAIIDIEIDDNDFIWSNRTSSGQFLQFVASPVAASFSFTLVDTPWAAFPIGGSSSSGITTSSSMAFKGADSGLVYLAHDTAAPASGMLAYVTNAYNTGWMPGDCKLCAVANSKTVDRSVSANTLTENGTVTEEAAATGTELNAYTGFSATNYLSRAYDADFDFGTGNFCVVAWFKVDSLPGFSVLLDRADNASGARFVISTATDDIQWLLNDGTNEKAINSTFAIDDSAWHHIVCVNDQTNDQILMYIDGQLNITGTSANIGNMNNATAVLRIGLATNGTGPFNKGTVSLVKICAYAPTAAQVLQMYNDEVDMFANNADCLIDGTSNAISEISHVNQQGTHTPEKLYAGTADGMTVFGDTDKSLFIRSAYIDSTGTITSDTVNTVSGASTAYSIGTAAEIAVNIPENAWK